MLDRLVLLNANLLPSSLPAATEILWPIAHSPTFPVSSIFQISSHGVATAAVAPPTRTERKTASCAANSAFAPSLDGASTTLNPRTLFPDKTRAFAPSATSLSGWSRPRNWKSSGAKGAKTFVRGRPLVKRGRRPSACAVASDKRKSTRRKRRTTRRQMPPRACAI